MKRDRTPRSTSAARRIAPPVTQRQAAAAAVAAALLLGGCAHRMETAAAPAMNMPGAFKEAPPGWVTATPADAADRGPWWSPFGDATLQALLPRVEVDNQTVAASAAAYAQAQALLRQQQAGYAPTLSASGGATRSGGGGSSTATSGTRYTLGLQAAWEPDLWGRVAGNVAAAGARADASAADLAAARLAAQAQAATTYYALRQTDATIALLRSTLVAYERNTRITRNRYDAGVVPRSDLLQAQTQQASTQSELAGLEQQRAQYEHALAVLLGQPPAAFALPADASWTLPALPAVPGLVPSELLQRRPDIAAAQRRVAAANASIGVAQAAYYPSFGLSGTLGQGARSVADLFSASAATWSLGLSLLQTIFDGGLRDAQVQAARADWEQAVASYRQTTLAAFQEVEDQLVAQRALAQQATLLQQAAEAATLTEQQVQNRYDAGQVSYSEVVQAQVTALNARRALLQATGNRVAAAVALVRALGGGWQAGA